MYAHTPIYGHCTQPHHESKSLQSKYEENVSTTNFNMINDPKYNMVEEQDFDVAEITDASKAETCC